MIQKYIYKAESNSLTVSNKDERNLTYFLYGFIIYTLFYVFSQIEDFFISAGACQGIQIIGFVLMTFSATKLAKFKFDDKYLEIVFGIYMLYSLTIVFRGTEYDFKSLKIFFLDAFFGALPYFAPLLILFPRNIKLYKKFFSILNILGICFILCVIIFYNTLHDPDRTNLSSQALIELFAVMLAIPVCFILFTHIYHQQKKERFGINLKSLLALIVMLLTVFFAIYRARRGLLFICLSSLLSAAFIYVLSSKKRALIILVSILLLSVCSLFIASVKTPAMFNYLMDRGTEDTRTGVEEYMYADMSSTDWIIGKGIKGSYYCPSVDNVNDEQGSGQRDTVETGYLQMILKGGIINVCLLFLILLPAVYKGLFNSKNSFSKAAAIWILLWIIYEYPTIGVGYTMHYILVWIGAGICYSKKIRNLSDSIIKTYLQE